MIFVILNQAAEDKELLLVDGGLCHFSQKKNGTVSIHEIIVLPSHRRKGIAQSLVQRVRDMHPGCKMRALCPVEYDSNKFWKSIGCEHKGIIKSEGTETRKQMNVWELEAEEQLELVPPPKKTF